MVAAFSRAPGRVMLLAMKGKVFLGSLAFAVLVLAVGGWTVRGVRWAAAAPARAFA